MVECKVFLLAKYSLAKSSMDNKAIIILVAPQMGENIGAAARAMKNFGLEELRIVNPRDGWPNEKAVSMAANAVDVIEQAKIYDDLNKAIADLEYLYATTAIPRDMNKDYVIAKDLKASYPRELKTGIMFGRENCGLNNNEIALANKILTINTAEFSSINIAQAVVIVCYELFKGQRKPEFANQQELASKEELNFFFDHLFNELDMRGFFRVAEKKARMTRNIINIFSRIDKLSRTELQTLRGLIRSLVEVQMVDEAVDHAKIYKNDRNHPLTGYKL